MYGWCCRLRHQLCAFLTEVIETTSHRLALHRVHVEGVVRYRRREVLQHPPQSYRRSEVTACSGLRRARHHANAVADHQPGFTDLAAVPLLRLRQCRRDERHDPWRGQCVGVFMEDDFEPVATIEWLPTCARVRTQTPLLRVPCPGEWPSACETQAIALRPLRVAGITGLLRLARPGRQRWSRPRRAPRRSPAPVRSNRHER